MRWLPASENLGNSHFNPWNATRALAGHHRTHRRSHLVQLSYSLLGQMVRGSQHCLAHHLDPKWEKHVKCYQNISILHSAGLGWLKSAAADIGCINSLHSHVSKGLPELPRSYDRAGGTVHMPFGLMSFLKVTASKWQWRGQVGNSLFWKDRKVQNVHPFYDSVHVRTAVHVHTEGRSLVEELLTGGPGSPWRPVNPRWPFWPRSPRSPWSPLSPRGPWGP